MDIKNNLIKFNQSKTPENFVAIAVQIDEEKLPFHAAILIRHKTINYLHHFPGIEPPIVVENFTEEGWYIYKIHESFNTEDESEIGAFLQYCRRVCSKSEITYSYIADGSCYDSDGNFVSNVGLPEFGTCVGFCINTFNNTLIDVDTTIFHLDDWDDSDINENVDNWSEGEVRKKFPDINWELYRLFKKRITPLEYLCSSFFKSYPIKKSDIDEVKPIVLEDIQSKF